MALAARAIATSPSWWAILWKAVDAIEIGDYIVRPKNEVDVPSNADGSTSAADLTLKSEKA